MRHENFPGTLIEEHSVPPGQMRTQLEALTSKSPMRRGTARALRAHPLFTSPTADEPPLACDEDWAALLPPRYDGDDGAADAHDEEASAASSWDRESDETAWTWEAPEV